MAVKNSSSQGVLPLSGILDGVLKKLGLERRVQESRILRDWETWVGPSIAQHAVPYRVINKKLVIYVDNSVWLAELTRFYKHKILQRIHKEVGKELIEEVILKIGEIPKESDR